MGDPPQGVLDLVMGHDQATQVILDLWIQEKVCRVKIRAVGRVSDHYDGLLEDEILDRGSGVSRFFVPVEPLVT